MKRLRLDFADPSSAAGYALLARSVVGKRGRIALHPYGDRARAFVASLAPPLVGVEFCAIAGGDRRGGSSPIGIVPDASYADAVFLFPEDAGELSELLMQFVDVEDAWVIAPRLSGFFADHPLFLISIPKSGTHLLYELASALGYEAGIECPDLPLPQHWYCVEYSNSHTVARDFFVDTVRRSPFGNRHHPFMRSPALFIYRNPLDILISEASYYHEDGNSAFSAYLRDLPFEQRLLRLVDDPWLLGSLRDRIGGFLPWLDFGNVVPVSFEELVGDEGGGSGDLQRKLIWSLQLKLQIPGEPSRIAGHVFNRESSTFRAGQIGSHVQHLTPALRAKLYELSPDYMEVLGYPLPGHWGFSDVRPLRAEEFRHRPLTLGSASFDETPLAIEHRYLGFNLLRFRRRFYAIPQDTGPLDLTELSEIQLSAFPSDTDLGELKGALLLAKPRPRQTLLAGIARRWRTGRFNMYRGRARHLRKRGAPTRNPRS